MLRIDLIKDVVMGQIKMTNASDALLNKPTQAIIQNGFLPDILAANTFDIDVISAGDAEHILDHWRELSNSALDDNPFLSPAFMIPAMTHLVDDIGLSLATVWLRDGAQRKLTGLFPLAAARRQVANAWLSPSKASFWRHPLQPFCLPLLAKPADVAEATVRAFMDWLEARRPRLTTLETAALLVGSKASTFIQQDMKRRDVSVVSRRDAAHTRGLDFRPVAAPPSVDSITIAQNHGEVRSALEHLLCFDARARNHKQNGPAVLSNPQHVAFLRATVRSFALEGKITIAVLDKASAQTGAIVLEGASKCYLWWIMGEHGADPMIEAALAAASEKAIGKPIVAATQRPLAGLWTEPLFTESMSVSLNP